MVAQVYDNGGLFIRANVGFEKFFMFGFSANGTNLVGNGTIQIQTPRLAFKIKPLDEKVSPVALAIGWDDRGYGIVSSGRFFPGTEEGFYAVVSHEFKELGWLQLHGGVNVVKFDNFDSSQDLGCFFGSSFAVTPVLAFNVEMNQVLTSYWQTNANVMFNLDNPLRIGLDLRDINRSDLFARVLRVQYLSFF
jgi:hypothetical protein